MATLHAVLAIALHACKFALEVADRDSPVSAPPRKGTVRDQNLSSDAPLRPDGPEFPPRPLDVAAVLDNYKPRLLPVTWEGPVSAFVGDAVAAADLPTERAVREAAGTLARLAAWALADGLPLDPEVVLDPAVVERYVTGRAQSQRSVATERALLRRLGRAATRHAPWEPRPAKLARRSVSAPYTPDEIAALWRIARSQPTASLRQIATATLLVGLSAGADGRWLPALRPSDVSRRHGAVLVAFPEPNARIVPALATYEEELEAFARSVTTKYLIGSTEPSRNLVSHALGRLHGDDTGLRISPARLRSTWLKTHILLGTYLPDLARAAGISGITVLSDLLPFVEGSNESEFIEQLRGKP
jgi:hypothetical protein